MMILYRDVLQTIIPCTSCGQACAATREADLHMLQLIICHHVAGLPAADALIHRTIIQQLLRIRCLLISRKPTLMRKIFYPDMYARHDLNIESACSWLDTRLRVKSYSHHAVVAVWQVDEDVVELRRVDDGGLRRYVVAGHTRWLQ